MPHIERFFRNQKWDKNLPELVLAIEQLLTIQRLGNTPLSSGDSKATSYLKLFYKMPLRRVR